MSLTWKRTVSYEECCLELLILSAILAVTWHGYRLWVTYGRPRSWHRALFGVTLYDMGALLDVTDDLVGLPSWVPGVVESTLLAVGAILGASGTISVISELARGSRRDPLTGTLNRIALEDAFRRETLLARRYDQSIGVLFIDLNGFKNVNDTHGHKKGDECLCSIGRAFTSCLRGSDLVARWGGDEFVALLPNTGPASVAPLLYRLECSLSTVECAGLTGGISVGIAFFPGDGEDLEHLISSADQRMYGMKNDRGRNPALLRPL